MIYGGEVSTIEIGAMLELLAVNERENTVDLFYRVHVHRSLFSPPPINILTLHMEGLFVGGYKELGFSPYQVESGSLRVARALDDEKVWYVYMRMLLK
jgi:hypothetical protein